MRPMRRPTQPIINAALREDLAAAGDLTSRALIPPTLRVRAVVRANSPGLVAGTRIAQQVFAAVDPRIRCRISRRDGQAVAPGQVILRVEGPARSILAAERTALNFLGHLSGIATLTNQFVRRARPARAAIMDTRKTLPGLRVLEKYAVRVGGGKNHRLGLSDAVLIKTNHLLAYSGQRIADRKKKTQVIGELVQGARRRYPKKMVEIEVTNLTEFEAALDAKPDVVMLDNWPLAAIYKAVRYATRYPLSARPLLEVSGGVTLQNVRAIARTGVDRISIGRLTHSAPALDVSLHIAD